MCCVVAVCCFIGYDFGRLEMKVLVDNVPEPPSGCVVSWDRPKFGEYFLLQGVWHRWPVREQSQSTWLVAKLGEQ